jgi:hypothetical protein
LNHAFEAKRCNEKGAPIPCATCTAPQRSKCTGGVCSH